MKNTFEVGKFVVISAGVGTSHQIPGEKNIVTLPDAGVTVTDRQIVFDKKTTICLEDRETYVLVGPYAPMVQAVVAAVMAEPEVAEMIKSINEKLPAVLEGIETFMNHVSFDGPISEIIDTVMELDYTSALGELVFIVKEYYPEYWTKIYEQIPQAQRAAFDVLVEQASAQFKKSDEEKEKDEMNALLKKFCKAMGVDPSVLTESDDDAEEDDEEDLEENDTTLDEGGGLEH